MAGKIVIEAIIYTVVYSLAMLILFKVQGARRQLYNYPPAIQKRAIEKGITTQEEMNANAKKNKPKWWVIPGTEDMTEAYHDYAFHWK